MYTLGAIGINRLVLITKQDLFRRIFTPLKLSIFVAILWIIPSGTFLIALINGVGAVGFDPFHKECGIVHTNARAKDLDLSMFAVGFPIPFTAIIVSYTWIYIYIKKHFRVQKQHLINLHATCTVSSGKSSTLIKIKESMDSGGTTNVSNPRIQEITMQQIQITKNLFFVVCAFLLCFVPPSTILLVDNSSPTLKGITWYLELLGFANSATNFFIYASKHPDFKIVLGYMMRCCFF